MRPWRYWAPEQYAGHLSEIDPGLRNMYSSAAVDTYTLVYYDFEDMDWQGWTQFDVTAQRDTFFHVDDFDGLGGGDYGYLVPINGSKSIWCGARPGTDEYMCGWYYAPGYGDHWDQSLVTTEIYFDGTLTLSYNGVFDSEEDYDYTHIEYDAGEGNWIEVQKWDGHGVEVAVSHDIHPNKVSTKLRFHFTSDGAVSDETSRINTDGACVIDDIVISDNTGILYMEDFEAWEVGAKSHPGSIWRAEPDPGFGIYSGFWTGLQDKDPCNNNFSTQIVFFVGSPLASTSYPGLYDTPFPKDLYTSQEEMIISPVIDLSKYSTSGDEMQDADIPSEVLDDLAGMILKFSVYTDLPLLNYVFFTWMVRPVDEFGCPGHWVFGGLHYGVDNYRFVSMNISPMADAERIQVALGVNDAHCYCGEWTGEHTPSPWFDNVKIIRYSTAGPQWSYRALDLFQDNFPEDEFDIESYVRADAADDKAASTDPYFIPGDSIVVTCDSPLGGGINEGGVTGGGEVYLHVRCTDLWPLRPGGTKPNLYGPSLEGTYGTYAATAGEWTILQCDTAKTQYVNPVPDRWSVDLNDSLLTRGYMVEYYFSAMDVSGDVTTLPEGGVGGAAGSGLTSGPDRIFEFTCLPSGQGGILYVDDFDGRGSHEGIAQLYLEQTFQAVISPENQPDRYDVNAPSSMVGNGLASRAKLSQLIYNDTDYSGYGGIIWDSGDLDVGTIGDGNTSYEKSDDCSLLINWMDQSENDAGLLVCGDNIAYDLSQNLGSPQALTLMNTWCGTDYITNSYLDLTGGMDGGGIVNPLLTGAEGSIFWNGGLPYEFYLYGGCPVLSAFDVLDTLNFGEKALLYPEYEGETYAAGIQSWRTNSKGYAARTVWLGFSWMAIRDTEPSVPLTRNQLFVQIRGWLNFGSSNSDITGMETPLVDRLCQNYPNPFNPTTTIKFDIRKKGHVSLRIYNVAGQLVRTLVNGELNAGSYTEEWTGLNNDGKKVASGVYFYRLESGEFESVKKMVLLR